MAQEQGESSEFRSNASSRPLTGLLVSRRVRPLELLQVDAGIYTYGAPGSANPALPDLSHKDDASVASLACDSIMSEGQPPCKGRCSLVTSAVQSDKLIKDGCFAGLRTWTEALSVLQHNSYSGLLFVFLHESPCWHCRTC